MKPTGQKSNTSLVSDDGRPWGPAVSLSGYFLLFLVMALTAARPVQALDVFTLWRQPMIPIEMPEGAWADYRFQVMAGGKRQQNLTRIICLDRRFGTDDKSWLMELVPLEENPDGTLTPVAGEGLRLRVSRTILRREGRLLDAVTEIVQWREGQEHPTSVAELRDDPLVSASLDSDFAPREVLVGRPNTRVIQGRQYLCDEFVFSAADTQFAALPAGRMVQQTTHEVTASVNSQIPFLGLAYATERIRSESFLDPPSSRMAAPPARVRVEIMELLGFGGGATPLLIPSD